LKQVEAGTWVTELCRKQGIGDAKLHQWRTNFGGMDVSMMTRMKELIA
jgi:putative transposase